MPRSRETLRRHRPDAPERVDRKLLQERLDAFRRDHGEAVGFPPRGGNLREELVWRDARRRRQSGLFVNQGLDSPGHVHAERLVPRVVGDVEVRLIEREGLDKRRRGQENRADTCFETALYFAKDGRTISSAGQSRTARDIGIAERTPNARAS